MQKKLLIVHFRDDISTSHEAECILIKSETPAQDAVIINAITAEFPQNTAELLKDKYAVILGGSGQYDISKNPEPLVKAMQKTNEFFKYIFENDFPAFGICLGHQLLAHNLGVDVLPDKKQHESLTVEVTKTNAAAADKLYSDLPEKFYVNTSHKESVMSIPNGAHQMLTNDTCDVQGFRYKNNVYGVQFHPELDIKGMEYRWNLYPEYIKSGKVEENVAKMHATPFAQQLLKNFVSYYKNHNK